MAKISKFIDIKIKEIGTILVPMLSFIQISKLFTFIGSCFFKSIRVKDYTKVDSFLWAIIVIFFIYLYEQRFKVSVTFTNKNGVVVDPVVVDVTPKPTDIIICIKTEHYKKRKKESILLLEFPTGVTLTGENKKEDGYLDGTDNILSIPISSFSKGEYKLKYAIALSEQTVNATSEDVQIKNKFVKVINKMKIVWGN